MKEKEKDQRRGRKRTKKKKSRNDNAEIWEGGGEKKSFISKEDSNAD